MKEKQKNVDVVINRAWIIYFLIGVFMLALGVVFLPEWISMLFFVIGIAFLMITVFFEPVKYEFADDGINFKGVMWQLAYIKYGHIYTLLVHWEWFGDSWILSELTQYYELYGPCEEKFKTHYGLRITKTKKTTELLKQHCPLKFSKPEERRKPVHRKRKPHQKKK